MGASRPFHTTTPIPDPARASKDAGPQTLLPVDSCGTCLLECV